jgi:hypothetical protein
LLLADVTHESVDTSVHLPVDIPRARKEMRMPTPSYPITPKHEQLIDEVLQLVLARVNELVPVIGYAELPPLSLEQMRTSSLAKDLRIIARYAEGYDLGQGSILLNIEHMARLLYPKPMSTSGYQFPPDFHQTPLGEMVNDALARHYPRERRATVGEVTKFLGVTRQTVHDWADDGTLEPIYDKGTLTFRRKQVEELQRRRAARKKE